MNTGAPASTEETATLPPTQTMPPAPAAIPRPGLEAAGRGGTGPGRVRSPVTGSGRVRARVSGMTVTLGG